MLSRIIYGARISLTVGIAAMVVTMAIGVAIGLSSGFFGGSADFLLMRFTDVMLTLRALLLAMALVAVLGPSLLTHPTGDRPGLVDPDRARGAGRDALDVAARFRACGARARRSLVAADRACTCCPTYLPTIVVMAALSTSGTLLLDAALSFLGLGVPPPTPSWGRMIEEATIYFRTAPWLAAFPGLAIFYAVLAFNLLGYGFLRRRGGR